MHYHALMIPTVSKYLHNHDKIYANATQNLSAYQDEQIMQNRM
jgi:hypothetical protein